MTYRVVVHDEPARDCWAEFTRGWDALEYAKAAARDGYVADVFYDGQLEVTYPAA